MKAWASAFLVVIGKWALPMPGMMWAAWRGPSLKASPCTEWPGAGTAGFASEADAVGWGGSSPKVDGAGLQAPRAARNAPNRLKQARIDKVSGGPIGVADRFQVRLIPGWCELVHRLNSHRCPGRSGQPFLV